MDKVQQDFKAQAKPNRKEGEIKVDYTKAAKTDEHLKGGEYVDYEEVK